MFKKGRNILSHQRPALFLADLVAIVCVCSLAYLLVGSTSLIKETYVDLLLLIGIFVLMNMLGLICFGVYKKLWRYANVQDFMGCILGIATGSLSAYLIALAARVSAPPILFAMMTCASLITVIGIRVVYKIVRERSQGTLMDMSWQPAGHDRGCGRCMPDSADGNAQYPMWISADLSGRRRSQ